MVISFPQEYYLFNLLFISLFPQDMIKDIYSLHCYTIHKSKGLA